MNENPEQKRQEQAVAKRLELSMQDYKQVVSHPLLALPAEVRPSALAFWTCNKHLKGLESALPIAAIFSVWIDQHGLRIDDANSILMGMLAPQKMQHFEFSGQVMKQLAAEASQAIARRRQEQEQSDNRERQARFESERATDEELQKVRKIANEFIDSCRL